MSADMQIWIFPSQHRSLEPSHSLRCPYGFRLDIRRTTRLPWQLLTGTYIKIIQVNVEFLLFSSRNPREDMLWHYTYTEQDITWELLVVAMSDELLPGEHWWRDHQPWLLGLGYRLRPRYRQDWVPSWLESGNDWLMSEDGATTPVRRRHNLS